MSLPIKSGENKWVGNWLPESTHPTDPTDHQWFCPEKVSSTEFLGERTSLGLTTLHQRPRKAQQLLYFLCKPRRASHHMLLLLRHCWKHPTHLQQPPRRQSSQHCGRLYSHSFFSLPPSWENVPRPPCLLHQTEQQLHLPGWNIALHALSLIIHLSNVQPIYVN